MLENGATYLTLDSSELRYITHLISITSDFPAYHDANEAFIHVVKPTWVEHSISKRRTANPRQYSPDPSLVLTDVVLTCANDIPEGDKDAILGGLLALGGQYSNVMTKLVTHVVALSENSPQFKLIQDKNLKCKAIIPHWFDDCLKLGKKLNTLPYELPDPPILKPQTPRHIQDTTHSQHLADSCLLEPEIGVLPSPSKKRRHLGVFKNQTIKLSQDLDIGQHLRNSLETLIRSGDGQCTDDVKLATFVVCQYRDGSDFLRAFRDNKEVGNLNWLYYMINHNIWTSPTRRLLHYPFPRNGLAGFKGLRVTISNYTGDARIFLESLIKAAGAEFTKTMTQENTHLITAHTFSEKVKAAKEWNVNMLNHLWLEESYAQGKMLAITNPKYTTFPSRTNLGEVVGQTQINRKAIEALHHNTTKGTTAGQDETDSNELVGATPLKYGQNVGRLLSKTPAHPQEISTPRSRSAKDRALHKLHNMVPDIALFEKESKRVGGVIYGGRKVTDPDRIMLNNGSPKSKKRCHTSENSEDNSTESDESVEVPANKKQKQQRSMTRPKKITRYVVTGGHKFGWTPATSKKIRKFAALELTELPPFDSPQGFDVLVANKILRTRKFVAGLAFGPDIVTADWLDKIADSKGDDTSTEGHELRDAASETAHGFKLKVSLERARKNRESGGLLRGWTVFCTESVRGKWESFEEIVTRNGGTCTLYKGRETKLPAVTARDNDDDHITTAESQPPLYLLTNASDKPLWKKFRTMAEKGGYTPMIVKPEFMLSACIAQDIHTWKDEWEWVEGVNDAECE